MTIIISIHYTFIILLYMLLSGLGGRGGPYRLDKGHEVHQVPVHMKQMSEAARQQASLLAAEAHAKRLEEIAMGQGDYQRYQRVKQSVLLEIEQLQHLFNEITQRSKERIWLRRQSHGDLDDTRLIDGITGDRLIFKRRGYASEESSSMFHEKQILPHLTDHSDHEFTSMKMNLLFVVDVSASMYRFNGRDGRLERMLEAMLMVLEAMPNSGVGNGITESDSLSMSRNDNNSLVSNELIDYAVYGHSGDSDEIKFIEFEESKPTNEKERLVVLEQMASHTQYTMSGDNTLQAMTKAVNMMSEKPQNTLKYVFIITDANFEMYNISTEDLTYAMTRHPDVEVHLIMIASLGDEALAYTKKLPTGRTHVCFENTDLPQLFKSILSTTANLNV